MVEACRDHVGGFLFANILKFSCILFSTFKIVSLKIDLTLN